MMPVAHDDARGARRDRLIELRCLLGVVALRVKHLQVNAEGLGLLAGAVEVLLEVVALARLLHDGNLGALLVEGCGGVGGRRRHARALTGSLRGSGVALRAAREGQCQDGCGAERTSCFHQSHRCVPFNLFGVFGTAVI